MKSPVVFLVTTAAFFPAYAFQFPFKLPFFSSASSQVPLVANDVPETQAIPNRIAIIGAGAAGSSAAFWISKAKERYGLDVEVDVYDKNAYIGGRESLSRPIPPPSLIACIPLRHPSIAFCVHFDSVLKETIHITGSTTVYPYDDPSLEPHELGASIFVKVNKNMWRAVDEFGLERIKFDSDDDEGVMGIWDGHEFVLTVYNTHFTLHSRKFHLRLDRWEWLLHQLA